jgi:alkaline phosphatase D
MFVQCDVPLLRMHCIHTRAVGHKGIAVLDWNRLCRWAMLVFAVSGGMEGSLARAAAVGLTHGPLVGAVRPRAAKIWVRTNGPAAMHLDYSPSAGFDAALVSGVVQTIQGSDFTGTVRLSGLSPETTYFYRVWLNGAALPDVYRFTTSPQDAALRTFSFAVLSDFSRAAAPVYAMVAQDNPTFIIFLGDWDHSDPPTLTKMRAMHRRMRGGESPVGLDFIRYLRRFPFYHVWDDHDFGIDDADKTFAGKPEALQAFREYFPSPALPSADGIWHAFRYAQAQFLMLDLRSQRDPNNTPDGPNKSILGSQQKAWLKEKLLQSTAQWKFLISTVPFNPDTKPQDSWAAFPTERREIVTFIQDNQLTGVIVLSGDLHSGGGLDNGMNADLPELSVPNANMTPSKCWTAATPGTWSEGIICGMGHPGYGLITVSPELVTLRIKGVDGSTRLSLEVR